MATATWVSVLDHTSALGFRNWGSEIGVRMSAVGMIQTADTGQIVWASVSAVPALSTSGGYEIWKFSDSSIFLKIEYGTAGSANQPQMWVTVGQGSNGSGTITGQTSARNTIMSGSNVQSTTTLYTSYMCATSNYFGMAWKMFATFGQGPAGSIQIGKTTDVNGNITNVGFQVLSSVSYGLFANQSANFFYGYNIWNTGRADSIRTLAPAATSVSELTDYVLIAENDYANLVNGQPQAFYILGTFPDFQPSLWSFVTRYAFVPIGTTCVSTLFGSTQHTYLSIGQFNFSTPPGTIVVKPDFGTNFWPYIAPPYFSQTTTVCMLWE